MSLYTFLHIKTSSPCLPNHCLVVTRWLLTGQQRDDVNRRAGDGTRTRDSLLGRQSVTRSPLVCYKSPSQVLPAPTFIFLAPLT
jgi:hypothetical protein